MSVIGAGKDISHMEFGESGEFLHGLSLVSLLGFDSKVALVNRWDIQVNECLSTPILNTKGVLGVLITKSMFVLMNLAIFFSSEGCPKLYFFLVSKVGDENPVKRP